MPESAAWHPINRMESPSDKLDDHVLDCLPMDAVAVPQPGKERDAAIPDTPGVAWEPEYHRKSL